MNVSGKGGRVCGGARGVGMAAAPPPPPRAGLCSAAGTSSTPRRRPRSGATRTPSAGSPSRTTRRSCPRPPPCPWRWWGRARSPASVSAPLPSPVPLVPARSASLLWGCPESKVKPCSVLLAPTCSWRVWGLRQRGWGWQQVMGLLPEVMGSCTVAQALPQGEGFLPQLCAHHKMLQVSMSLCKPAF